MVFTNRVLRWIENYSHLERADFARQNRSIRKLFPLRRRQTPKVLFPHTNLIKIFNFSEPEPYSPFKLPERKCPVFKYYI